MAAYLITSILSGFIAMTYGIMANSVGVLGALGWYVLGCWSGFALLLALVLAMSALRKSRTSAPRLLLSA